MPLGPLGEWAWLGVDLYELSPPPPSLRGKELPGAYMQELNLDAEGQLVSKKRRVKVNIAQALLPDYAQEAVRLAEEVKRLGKPRGVEDSAYRTCARKGARSLRDGLCVRF